MAFVRKKRVGPYEYYHLVENHQIMGQSRQRVSVHPGRYPSAETALEQWPGGKLHELLVNPARKRTASQALSAFCAAPTREFSAGADEWIRSKPPPPKQKDTQCLLIEHLLKVLTHLLLHLIRRATIGI